MDQKILCISGRKQAGKDTCYRFLHGLLTGSNEVRQFYFAEPLKRLCVDILGCPEGKVYGTDADKNTAVGHLLWENFPVTVLTDGTIVGHKLYNICDWGEDKERPIFAEPSILSPGQRPRSGPMTVREVLQYWGSEIFRRQYQDVWADACIRAIRKSGVPFAVITDCRFPNEVSAAQRAGGKVIRLSRVVFPNDTHVSETALDPDQFEWKNFDIIINNRWMTVEEQCRTLYHVLSESFGWFPVLPDHVVAEHARRAAA